MYTVMGTFDGSGAVINVGVGFIPNRVELINLEETPEIEALYYSDMKRDLATIDRAEGHLVTDGVPSPLAITAGISPFLGGAVISAASETNKVKDPSPNKRGSGSEGTISTWTLDTSSAKTGHFDLLIDETIVVIGAEVVIDGKSYYITAITSDGSDANDITLNLAAPSGRVDFIGSNLTFVPAATGIIMPEGFTLAAHADINADTETLMFVATHF